VLHSNKSTGIFKQTSVSAVPFRANETAVVLKLPATQKQKAITETTVDAERFPM
jgi:hypothetical protein